MAEKRAAVLIVMGSQSDWEIMKETARILDRFNIPYETVVSSAHRSPELTTKIASSARAKGYEVIIAGAGGAAHLPGVLASRTELPVIGVPLDQSGLKGLDSILSIVQMPSGVPVACMALGKAGAANAALFAVQILGLKDPTLRRKYQQFKKEMEAGIRGLMENREKA